MAPRRKRSRRPAPAARTTLERRLARLEERVAKLEDRRGPVPAGKALPGDGRGRSRPEPPPHCPGCRLHVDPGPEKCPWCGLVFAALPPRLRPGGKDNPAPLKGKRRR